MKLPHLVALTPGQVEDAQVHRLKGAVRAALGAGLPGVLLREERLSDRVWIALGQALRDACTEFGAWFGVHDRVHLARYVGADGVHLGFRSLSPDALGERFADLVDGVDVGISTHAETNPCEAQARGVSYAFYGPVRTPTSKAPDSPAWRAAVGFEGLRERCADVDGRYRVLALGGMRPDDIGPARAAGAHGIAVLGGILGSDDPAQRAREYGKALAREIPSV